MDQPKNIEKPVEKLAEKPAVKSPKKKLTKRNKAILLSILLLVVVGGVLYYLNGQKNSKDLITYAQMVDTAEISYNSHEYADALNTLNEAIALVPNSPEAYQLTLNILIDKNQLGKASEVLTSVSPALSKASVSGMWGAIGQAYYDMGDLTNAKKALEQSLDKQSSPTYSLLMAKVVLASGSIEDLDQLLKDSDDPLKTMWEEYKVKSADEELSLFDATKSARKFINAGYPYLGIKLLEPKALDAAEYWEALYYLGKAYWDLGSSEKALTYLEQALTLGSEDSGLYTVTARVQYDLDDLNNAIKSYDRALAFSPDDNVPELLEEYIAMLVEEGQFSKALATLVEYALDDDADSSLLYARVYIASEDMDKLKVALDEIEALEVGQDWMNYREYLIISGEYYGDEKEYEKVAEVVGVLVSMDKYDPYGAYLTGLVHMSKEEFDLAKEQLELAIDLDLTGEVTAKAKGLLSEIE